MAPLWADVNFTCVYWHPNIATLTGQTSKDSHQANKQFYKEMMHSDWKTKSLDLNSYAQMQQLPSCLLSSL